MLKIYEDASVDTITAYLKDSPVKAFTRRNEEVSLPVQPDGYVIIPAGHRVRVPTGLSVEPDEKGFLMQTAGVAFAMALQFIDPMVSVSEGDLFIDLINLSEMSVILNHGDNLGKLVQLS
ncbi:MAG: monomeric viral dUTPase [Siphoviridae sp. ctdc_1]|nr:MAG: monomeric viral dUTPase [Siphoviridae sp. ctdc_1]